MLQISWNSFEFQFTYHQLSIIKFFEKHRWLSIYYNHNKLENISCIFYSAIFFWVYFKQKKKKKKKGKKKKKEKSFQVQGHFFPLDPWCMKHTIYTSI